MRVVHGRGVFIAFLFGLVLFVLLVGGVRDHGGGIDVGEFWTRW